MLTMACNELHDIQPFSINSDAEDREQMVSVVGLFVNTD